MSLLQIFFNKILSIFLYICYNKSHFLILCLFLLIKLQNFYNYVYLITLCIFNYVFFLSTSSVYNVDNFVNNFKFHILTYKIIHSLYVDSLWIIFYILYFLFMYTFNLIINYYSDTKKRIGKINHTYSKFLCILIYVILWIICYSINSYFKM